MPESTREPLPRESFQIRLENYRAFADSEWVRFAPLTCLVGRNSSGKSSLLSAVLLLKQSIEQQVPSSTLTPLSLSGAYCDLGNYTDVVHGHNESAELSISFSIPLKLLQPPTGPLRAFVNLQVPRAPTLFRSGYYSRFPDHVLPTTGKIAARLTFSTDEPFGPSVSRIAIEVDGVGEARFVRTLSGERRQHWRVYTDVLPPKSVRLRLSPNSFFPFIDVRNASYAQSAPRTKQRIRRFATASQALFSFLTRTLTRSEVIGPFRTAPQRRYTFGGFSTTKTGPSGEQAIDLLITEALLKSTSSHSLRAATSFWIKHLRLADSLNVDDIAKKLNLFEFNVSGAGRAGSANLADVGFGISQVLPVIIQGLLTRPGGIYLVQQPEIHLHPDAQAGLADFFMYLATYGVRTIVETHSEYLLIRLRRRLAEGKGPLQTGLPIEQTATRPLAKDDVAILLAEDAEDGGAHIRELEIGEAFQFSNLPKGFMSQSLDDRIALLKAVGKSDG
jgi:predicted ATPase